MQQQQAEQKRAEQRQAAAHHAREQRERERTAEESRVATRVAALRQVSDIRHTAHNQDTAETDRTDTSNADKYTQETPISHHRSQLSTAGLIQSYSQSQSPTVKATSQQLQLQSQSITITQLGPPSDPAPAFDRIAEFVANMSEQHNGISDYHYQSI